MDDNNFTEFTVMANNRYTFLIIHEVVFTIFCVIGICLNITIINTVYGFNRMRTAANIFIANWALADIFSLLITPTTYDIIVGLSRFMGYLPLLQRIGIIMHSTEILCVAVVAVDWILVGCFPVASQRYRNCYRYVIGIIWLFPMIAIMTALTICRKRWYCPLEGIELIVCYLSLALIILVVQFWRGIQKCRKRPLEPPGLFINLTSIFLLTWVFGFFNISEFFYVVEHPLTSIIFDCLTFSTPIINFALLYHYNQDFQACFSQLFSRASNKYIEEVPDTIETELENGRNTFMTINNTNSFS